MGKKIDWDALARAREEEGMKPPRKRPQYREDDLQKACVRWFDLQYKGLRCLMHHSPNEGKRSEREGLNQKLKGMRPGFPDLIFLWGCEQYEFLAIEVKLKGDKTLGSKTTYQSADEKAWQDQAVDNGGLYVIVRSVEGFKDIVNQYIKWCRDWQKKKGDIQWRVTD